MVGWSLVSKNSESKRVESSYICEEGTVTCTAALQKIFYRAESTSYSSRLKISQKINPEGGKAIKIMLCLNDPNHLLPVISQNFILSLYFEKI